MMSYSNKNQNASFSYTSWFTKVKRDTIKWLIYVLQPPNALGVSTIRYKTQLLNGTFEITSEPGQGTPTFIRLPIRVN